MALGLNGALLPLPVHQSPSHLIQGEGLTDAKPGTLVAEGVSFFLLLVLNEIIIREGPEKQILSRKQNKKGLSRKNNPGAEAAELGSQWCGLGGKCTGVEPGPAYEQQRPLGKFTDLAQAQFFHL